MNCPTCGQEIKDFPEYRCKCGVLMVGKTQKELDAAIKSHKCPVKCPKNAVVSK